MSLKNLCRLCAAKEDFLKDLMDESNKNVLKIIQDFIQIDIKDNNELPTKICLNCEEKVVSFQLFVLECYKVQDTLKEMQFQNVNTMMIKIEDDGVAYVVPNIKAEVKEELTAEDIVSEINDQVLSELNEGTYDNEDDDYCDYDEDDLTIASLKELKNVESKSKLKPLSQEDTAKLNQVLMQPTLKVKDLVKLKCHICDQEMKLLQDLIDHTNNVHQTHMEIYCICGYAIWSKHELYNHYAYHKKESKGMKNKINKIKRENDISNGKKYLTGKIKDFVSFKCYNCQEEQHSWYKLLIHCQKVHKTKPTVHCVCGVVLKSKSVLYKHVQDHNDPNAFRCDKCPRITKTQSALIKHKMRHVPKAERKFACSTCNKLFSSKDCLKSHVRSHLPIEERKIFHCDMCNMKFTSRSSLASHKRVVHDKIKSYVCDLCGYACGTNGELRQHRAIHSDEKPFVCSKCSKSFKTYSNLKTHMDTHEGTSYACFVCSRILNSRRTLRKHLLVHDDKARHVCSYCNKAFKRRQTLKVHLNTHTGDKPLSCKWCDEKFAYASTLRSHRLRYHPDKVSAQGYMCSHVNQDYIKEDSSINAMS